MARSDKLIKRFKSRSKDFSWDKRTRFLKQLGFLEIQGSGSRVRFYHPKKDCVIQLHKPHPSYLLKSYMVKEVLKLLTREELI